MLSRLKAIHGKRRIEKSFRELREFRKIMHRCCRRFSLNSVGIMQAVDGLIHSSREIKKTDDPAKLNKLFRDYNKDMKAFTRRLNKTMKSRVYPRISSSLCDMKKSGGEADDQIPNLIKKIEAESRHVIREKDIASLRKTIGDYFRIEEKFVNPSIREEEYAGVRNLLYNRLNARELGEVNISYVNALVDPAAAKHILNRFIYEVVNNEGDLSGYEYRWGSYIKKPVAEIPAPVNENEKLEVFLKNIPYGVLTMDTLNLLYADDREVRDMVGYLTRKLGYLRYECMDGTGLLYNLDLITDAIRDKINQPPAGIYLQYNRLFRRDLDRKDRLTDLRNTLKNLLYPK